jgi:multiple sugar transport system ATP-binding protein
MTMADRVAVMRGGVLQQYDTPDRVYTHPANLFVASFIGSPAMNLVVGGIEAGEGGLRCRIGETAVRLPEQTLERHPALRERAGTQVAVGIRPETLSLDSEQNGTLAGRVVVSESLGFESLVYARVDAAGVSHPDVLDSAADLEDDLSSRSGDDAGVLVVARVPAGTAVADGDAVRLGVDGAALHFFDLGSGAAIH